MISLGILLTRQHRLLSLAAILDVFSFANQLAVKQGKSPCFSISLIGLSDRYNLTDQEFLFYKLANAPRHSVILIPAFATEELGKAIEINAEFIPWLCNQYRQGTEIASFCTGAFLLAATGLLHEKQATTHVQAAEALSKTFPTIRINAKEITTFDKGLYTSGGATNSFYLMFKIIEKYCGPALALSTAKYFAVDLDREQQIYFSTFQPVINHRDELVIDLQKKMENHYGEVQTIEKLLAEIPASRRNLVRRFKGATGITPIEYLQKTRIEAAKKLLEETGCSILDIMLQVGYNDLKTFRQLFKKSTGLTPTGYRAKFVSKLILAN